MQHTVALQIGPLFYEAAAAIYGVSPTTLIMVEGSGQLGYPGINYGDGFVTDAALISQCALLQLPQSCLLRLSAAAQHLPARPADNACSSASLPSGMTTRASLHASNALWPHGSP